MSNVPVIAYPIPGIHGGSNTSSPSIKNNNSMDMGLDTSFYNMNLNQSNLAEDSMEIGGNFFSQLDSMIQAVKVESTALDSMRDKLKEVDNLRSQLSAFNKRVIDAEQTILNLRSNLVKAQEAYGELKKQKMDVESQMVPMRQELNRAKDIIQKEKTLRSQLQQENMSLKEQIARLEGLNSQYESEIKTIPILNESNEMIKNDLEKLRKRYKDDKIQMMKRIKELETSHRTVDSMKTELKTVASKLMEIAGGTSGVQLVNSSNNPLQQGGGSRVMQDIRTYQHSQYNTYEEDEYEDDDNEDDDEIDNHDDIQFDGGSYADDVNSSIDSIVTHQSRQVGQTVILGQTNQQMQQSHRNVNNQPKKKKTKKLTTRSSGNMQQQQGMLPRIH